MNRQQQQYILNHYKTKSVRDLADALKMDRKVVQRELRNLLAAPPAPKEKPLEAKSVPAKAPGFEFKKYWVWGILFLIVFFAVLIRVRLLPVPLERDEGDYAYNAQLLLQGIPPYRDAYEMRLPGIFAAYALILAVFGQTQAGIHLGLLVMNAITTLIMFFLGKRLFNPAAGLASAAAFALLSLSASVQGVFANTEHFVILPALGGIWLLLYALESNRPGGFFLAGVLLGIGFLMKQHGIFFAAFGGLYLVYHEFSLRPFSWRQLLTKAILFGAGFAFPFAITCLILWKAGVFGKFWFWTFTIAKGYVTSADEFSSGPLSRFLLKTGAMMKPFFTVWILAGAGLASFFWERSVRPRAFFILSFLAFSVFSIFPGLHFREHYFIFLLPAAALLCGTAVYSVEGIFEGSASAALKKRARVLLILVPVLFSIFQQRGYLLEMAPDAVSRKIYGLNPFPESPEIARYIQKNTSETDRIAVLGSEPQIYFYSGRRSATSHILTYPLMEIHRYAREMQEEMIRQVEAAAPKFLVFVNVPTSWLTRPESEKLIFDWFERYKKDFYETAGIADLLPEGTQYRWDEAAKGYTPRSPFWVSILRRKS